MDSLVLLCIQKETAGFRTNKNGEEKKKGTWFDSIQIFR